MAKRDKSGEPAASYDRLKSEAARDAKFGPAGDLGSRLVAPGVRKASTHKTRQAIPAVGKPGESVGGDAVAPPRGVAVGSVPVVCAGDALYMLESSGTFSHGEVSGSFGATMRDVFDRGHRRRPVGSRRRADRDGRGGHEFGHAAPSLRRLHR